VDSDGMSFLNAHHFNIYGSTFHDIQGDLNHYDIQGIMHQNNIQVNQDPCEVQEYLDSESGGLLSRSSKYKHEPFQQDFLPYTERSLSMLLTTPMSATCLQNAILRLAWPS
jgi:hypothetical protein